MGLHLVLRQVACLLDGEVAGGEGEVAECLLGAAGVLGQKDRPVSGIEGADAAAVPDPIAPCQHTFGRTLHAGEDAVPVDPQRGHPLAARVEGEFADLFGLVDGNPSLGCRDHQCTFGGVAEAVPVRGVFVGRQDAGVAREQTHAEEVADATFLLLRSETSVVAANDPVRAVAGAGYLVGDASEDGGHYGHLVLGERSGLVGADHLGRAQRLDSAQSLHQSVCPCEVPGRLRQRGVHLCRQTLIAGSWGANLPRNAGGRLRFSRRDDTSVSRTIRIGFSGEPCRAVGAEPGEELVEFVRRLEDAGCGEVGAVADRPDIAEQFIEVDAVTAVLRRQRLRVGGHDSHLLTRVSVPG